MNKRLILGMTLVLMLSGQVSAAPIQTNTGSIAKVEIKNPTKEDYMKYITKPIRITYLHTAESIEEWTLKDINYLETVHNQDTLQEESEALMELVEIMRSDYITIKGSKVYGFKQVAYMDALISAINHRQGIISGDTTLIKRDKLSAGRKDYAVISKTTELDSSNFISTLLSQWDMLDTSNLVPDEKNLIAVSEGIWEALMDYAVPKKTLENLSIHISPYYLVGYLGFTTGYHRVGREEEVLIASSGDYEEDKQTAIDTTLHELGHVFMSDVVGKVGGDKDALFVQNTANWNKLYANYPETHTMTLENRIYSIGESFAEQFRCYLQGKASKLGLEIAPYREDFAFIEEQLKTYSPDTELSIPNLSIQGVSVVSTEFCDGMALRFKTNTLQAKISDWNLDKKALTYTLLKKNEATNSAIRLIEKEPVTDTTLEFQVDPGQYALLFYTQDNLLRFNEFGITH